MVLKSAKRGRQRTWAHTQWRLGHSCDLGATVPGSCSLASDDPINLISKFMEFLLSVSFCSCVVLDFGLMHFNNFKSGAQNTTRNHNSGLTEDFGAPGCAPTWFSDLGAPAVAPKV